MADMTLSWARLRWPRCASRQAGPAPRKMSATSSVGRMAPRYGVRAFSIGLTTSRRTSVATCV
jgi:hypothetical protein